MVSRPTTAKIVEVAFWLLGSGVGATLGALMGYSLFADTGAIVLGLGGLVLGFVGTRAGADWLHIFH